MTAPRVLSFTAPLKKTFKARFQGLQRRFALAAAACLLMALGFTLNQQSSGPERQDGRTSERALFAMRGNPLADTTTKPEPDLVAMADDFSSRNEFEKALSGG